MALAVGQRWKRRNPQGDEWDGIVVRGFAEGGETVEVVVSPVSFGSPVSTSPQALLAAYTLDAPDPAAGLKERIEEWITPEEEVANG